MKTVIVGAGNVGSFIAIELLDAGHEVVVVERNPALVSDLAGRDRFAGIALVAGDGCEVTTLDGAGLASADVVAAVTGDDEDNLVIALLAKQEFAVPRVVARVNHPENEWLFDESWGVDVSVSTPHLLTALVEEAVSVGTLVRLLSLENGKAQLVEVTLTGTSPALGRSISELAFPRGSTVVAVLRSGGVVVPRGDTVLYEGDEAIVLVTDDTEQDIRRLLLA